jgi:prepilin-type N-terminal cleavage/methylation domain-containing protein
MFVFNNKKGFTLIELSVAMVIATIVMAAIYSTYRSQLRSHITQQTLVEMQQNARASMFVMEREIKMAGYGISDPALGKILIADTTQIKFIRTAPNEEIRYALTVDGGLGREVWNPPGGAGTLQTVAENIEVLNFIYLDGQGNVIATPLDFANAVDRPALDSIRSIQITLIARSGANVPVLMMKHTDHHTYTNQQGDILLADPDDNFRRIVLTAAVQCRNLVL